MNKLLFSTVLALSIYAQPAWADNTWLPSDYYQTNISPNVTIPSGFVTKLSPKLGSDKFILVTKLGEEANPTGTYAQPVADRWLNKYGSKLPKNYTLITYVQNPFDAARGSIYVVVDKSLRQSLTSEYLTDEVVRPAINQYFKTIPQRPTEGFIYMINKVDEKVASDIWWNDWWIGFWTLAKTGMLAVVTFGATGTITYVVLNKLEEKKKYLAEVKSLLSDLSLIFEATGSLVEFVRADTYEGETKEQSDKLLSCYDNVVLQEYSVFLTNGLTKIDLVIGESILAKFKLLKSDLEQFLKVNDEAVALFRDLPIVEGENNNFVFDNSKDPVKNKRLLEEEKARRVARSYKTRRS